MNLIDVLNLKNSVKLGARKQPCDPSECPDRRAP